MLGGISVGAGITVGLELVLDWNYCWARISDGLELGLGLN